MDRDLSRAITMEALGAVFAAAIETGEQLEPNGVIDALLAYYVEVYEAAQWGTTEDMIDEAGEWVIAILEDRDDGEGHVE